MAQKQRESGDYVDKGFWRFIYTGRDHLIPDEETMATDVEKAHFGLPKSYFKEDKSLKPGDKPLANFNKHYKSMEELRRETGIDCPDIYGECKCGKIIDSVLGFLEALVDRELITFSGFSKALADRESKKN